ncbi:hypothetical protein [Mycobacterium heckeshornense]|uniref:Uncharacterized protein n=2 Tax=Mycobacterium heckeshornense TaxID=110505 RepID=A0A7R7GUP4_9MYCO|nr:hypothetical protein [Mycobacterium heckeshornense]MCV7036733.1 hypothetical protein [Mycobacterium heckeshornense]BCO36297.1 hypothetical protein MHEC_27300 [Mycobacterium heckeshornense]
MMSRPACEQLVQLVRGHLEMVAEAITDVQAKGILVMSDSILANVANRCSHEVAWMHEEISAVLAEADNYVANRQPGAHTVAEAIASVRNLDSTSLHVGDVQRRYDAASEVLSRLIENCRAADTATRSRVEQLLEQRLSREFDIRGSFALAGRS